MLRARLFTIALFACSLVACRAPAPATVAAKELSWPVPPGWNHETIPFPLDFAPELPYRGEEQLRFAPGFLTPEAPAFWSYEFLWWLDAKPKFDASTISTSLRDYFRGLALAVGKDKYAFDPEHFRAELQPRSDSVLVGRVYTYDPFKTGQPLVLNLEARSCTCPGSGHHAILFVLSPKPFDDAVWNQLRECASALRCD